MYRITLLSDASGEQSDIAALSVLSHRVDLYPLATSAKRFETAHHDVVMIDARRKLIEARNTAQALKTPNAADDRITVFSFIICSRFMFRK